MGLSGIILKRKENVNIKKIAKDIIVAATNAGLKSSIDKNLYDSLDEGVYTTANIANTFDDIPESKQILMYLYSTSENDYEDEFNWIQNNGKLMQIINIEDFDDCEEILLLFLYEYLKINPEDFFWDEMDWFYTYNDIDRIVKEEFDKNWCYKKPR